MRIQGIDVLTFDADFSSESNIERILGNLPIKISMKNGSLNKIAAYCKSDLTGARKIVVQPVNGEIVVMYHEKLEFPRYQSVVMTDDALRFHDDFENANVTIRRYVSR